jgi:hypothetical protein
MKPKNMSENIGFYEAGDYVVSAAIWRPTCGFGPSFEIGIRHKITGKFWLLQSALWNHQSVQEMANVVATMLGDKTQCYAPEWFQKYICME